MCAVHLPHTARAEGRDDLVGTDAKSRGQDRCETARDPSPSGAQRADRQARTRWRRAGDRGSRRPGCPPLTTTRLHAATPRRQQWPRPGRRRALRPAVPRRLETAPSRAAIARRSRSNLGAELAIEPRFRGAPVALGGRWGHAEHMGRLLDREPAKRTKLDDLRQFSVDRLPGARARDPTRGWACRLPRRRPGLHRSTRSARPRPVCARRDDGRDRPGCDA